MVSQHFSGVMEDCAIVRGRCHEIESCPSPRPPRVCFAYLEFCLCLNNLEERQNCKGLSTCPVCNSISEFHVLLYCVSVK